MYKYFILFILYIPIFSAIYYLNQIAGILEFILWMIMYLSIFYFFHVLWRYYRKKDYLHIIEYAKKFYISLATLLLFSVWILWSFWYYQLIHKPLNLEQITISNWDKTVVFQKMIHIAKSDYYSDIASDIENHKNNGYVYYFEWVKWWTDESINTFNKALWIEFDLNLYDNLSKLYWLVPQNNLDFLNIINTQDYNIDMNIDEIISEYESLKVSKNIVKEYEPPIDINTEIINTLSELSSRQLEVLQFVNLTFLTTLTKNEEFLQSIQNSFWNQLLFEIILEWRNKIVVEKIINSEDKKIFATYWALHFDGIFTWLQKNDPNWKIISTKSFFPFQGK